MNKPQLVAIRHHKQYVVADCTVKTEFMFFVGL